jgi:short-subunit dehydrogenase
MASMCLPVCPGATATPFHDVAGNEGTFLTKIMDSPETVAKTALCAMKCGCPMVVTGLLNKPLPFIIRLMPRRCMTWIAGKLSCALIVLTKAEYTFRLC